jgi:23S rRNA (pseudouridine1915-N3)-methyltransferase
MSIRVLAVGKKHESWVNDGIVRYEKRLRNPWKISWQFLKHSSQAKDAARQEESERLLGKLGKDDWVVLLDERGSEFTSPGVARQLAQVFEQSRAVTVVIGGAYGVDERVRARADVVWSLSQLVFPHQLVRLILTEQLYRAQEIAAGRPYHHV